MKIKLQSSDNPHLYRINQLNSGLVTTNHLTECLQIDQLYLFEIVLGQVCQQARVDNMLKKLGTLDPSSGILAKMKFIGMVLADNLSQFDHDDKVYTTLSQHVSDTVRGWACFLLAAKSSSLSIAQLLIKIRLFASDFHFAVREWAWMSVREKLVSDLLFTINLLHSWVIDPNPYIRRFAIESIRPRGVWCKHIEILKSQPQLALLLLEPLKNESITYVQHSVANWLNDVSKTQPAWVINLCNQWLCESNTAFTQFIVKRALRTINNNV